MKDGWVFETKLDDTGFEAGSEEMKRAIERLIESVQELADKFATTD